MPPIEAGPVKTVWGLPTLAWGILIGCTILAVLTLATLFLCCWLLPRSRKFLSPTRYASTRTTVSSIPTTTNNSASRDIIMAHHPLSQQGSVCGGVDKQQGNSNTNNGMIYHQAAPPQYNPPPVPYKNASTSTQTTFQQQQQQLHNYYYRQPQQQQLQQQQHQIILQQSHLHNCCPIQQQQQQQNHVQQQQQQQPPKLHNYYRVNPAVTHQQSCKHQAMATCGGNSNSNNGSPNSGGSGSVSGAANGIVDSCSSHHKAAIVPEAHKSMWAINPLYSSSSGLNDTETAYRTRSLPSWGKGNNRPRPVSTTDDLEELYAKVNFSKKRRNRMRNDEAAIIALCRSRSQNLAGIPLEREGIVVYDERTVL